jgi:phage terminase large subunit
LGQVGILDGACIPDWDRIGTVPEEARLLCYGLDFGYTNDPSALVAMYKYNDGYILDEVLYKTGMLNSDISNFIRSECDASVYTFADSAEPKSIDELKKRGHKISGTQKGRDSVVHGINLMNQQRLWVTDRSKNLVNELQNYVWMKDKDGSTLNKPVDAFNHAIDAARYAISEQLRNPHRGKYYIY